MSAILSTPAPVRAPAVPRRRQISFVAAAFSLAASICSAGTPLTLPEAQQLALQRTHQLAALDLSADAARQMAVAAGQLPDPVLKAGIDNLPVSGGDRFSLGADFMTMRRIGISQELTSADKRRRRAELYGEEAGKALVARDAAVAKIERETALAWLECHFARKAERLVGEQMTQARNEVEAAEAAYRGGRGSLADIATARGLLAAVQDRASEAAQRSRSAALLLARWTGAESGDPLAEPPSMDTVRIDSASLETVLPHHPDIAVLTQQERIAKAEANLAEASRTPDWSVEVAFQQRGSGYSNMVSVGVSVPLQWDRAKRQDRELGAKLALAEVAKAEREETQRGHLAEVRTMLTEWESGRERHRRYAEELLPFARQRTEATLAAYRGGKATLADLLGAHRAETDAGLQALQLQAQTARLWAQLNYLFPSGARNSIQEAK
ncbi:TolC family protein [Pseudoduganella aquatica]|uniref:TolC family protein n=1 Tax=Pseudoduganella aquatica TaxID=2660641 RepID=UPI001E570CB8|nr:TolC family protein [Pseudoduganella aquatica]